ncbi:BMP family ABC transporter substrate-binding protein [Plantibacter sp. YIM 135249]|uniref:BMP family ABC transporter substrate-binding protein n=1 Tax=Plantibacter sp. YIM 135249 TaxID=3423918 RepID=UPI003D356F6D
MSASLRRLVVGASVLSLSLGLAACATPAGDSGAAGSDAKSIIIIVPTTVAGDNFIALAADGAKEAGKKSGASVKVYESNNDPQLIQQNIDAAVRTKPDLIIGVSYSVQEQFEAAAKADAKQQFLLVDQAASVELPNLTSVVFKEYEAAYLVGVEAGLLTKTNKIGVVGAVDSPFIHRWIDPYFAGAKSVNPAVETSAQYVGGDNPFGDVVRSKAQAQILAGNGVDLIQAASSGGNGGTFEAAKENSIGAFGVTTNQCPDAPGTVIDNNLKRVDVGIVDAVEQIFAGKTGGAKVYGLAEGGVSVSALEPDVATSKCLIADHPDVIAKVKEIRDEIVSGKIVVPDPLAAG